MALIAEGYAALFNMQYTDASKCFTEVRDRISTQKFFLHWYWRMQAELGLSNVFLESGDISNAQCEADRFLQSALSASDPNLQALAWTMKVRVAMTLKEWPAAEDALAKAIAIVDNFEAPLAAWQVHSAAWELYTRVNREDKSEQHRKRSESILFAIADSLNSDKSLRETFLKAPPIRRILERTCTKAAFAS